MAAAATKVEISDPQELRANDSAMEFLSSIGPDELHLSLFSESLSSFSESGSELGPFSVAVVPSSFRQEKCFLVRMRSQSCVHGAPCGSDVTAYVTAELETLEQQQREYLQLRGISLEKKTEIRRKGDRIEISRVTTEGQQIRQETKSYEIRTPSGVISEASNLLIMRLMARRRLSQNLQFLTFDAEMNLCISSYRGLGSRPQLIGRDTVEVYGVERAILSDDVPVTWQCCFLPDGHLSSRVQVGSPLTIRLTRMPILSEPDDIDPAPRFGKAPLSWEEDAQLYPEFLERKGELMSDHQTYLRRHPDMAALLSDFMQFLLLRKPQDVITFAAEYFGPFSSSEERGETFQSSMISNPFQDDSE